MTPIISTALFIPIHCHRPTAINHFVVNANEKSLPVHPARLDRQHSDGLAWLVIAHTRQPASCQGGLVQLGAAGQRGHGFAAGRGLGAMPRAAAGTGLLSGVGGTAGGGSGGRHGWVVPVRFATAGLWRGHRRNGRGPFVHARDMAQAGRRLM